MATFLRKPKRFKLSYRGDIGEQTLDITMSFRKPVVDGMPEAQMSQVAKHMTMGVAGGSEFAPELSTARHELGPLQRAEGRGKSANYHWRFAVRGISARYMVHLISRMRFAAHEDAQEMTILGSLKPDSTSASIKAAEVAAAIISHDQWAGAFASPGFRIVDVDTEKGVSIGLKTVKVIRAASVAAFSSYLGEWVDAVAMMPKVGGFGAFQASSPSGKDRSEMSVRYESFPIASRPARDQLVNFLIRYHQTVCPLAQVELGFPKSR